MLMPKIGTPRLAELEFPEMAMMEEESFQLNPGPEDRHDLGYLANPAEARPGQSQYGVTEGPRDMGRSSEGRDSGITKSRTEGDTPRETRMDTSSPSGRSASSPDEGGTPSTVESQSNPTVMDRMSEFQEVLKKMAKGKNLGRVDRSAEERAATRELRGAERAKDTGAAERVAGAQVSQQGEANKGADKAPTATDAIRNVQTVSDTQKTLRMSGESQGIGKFGAALNQAAEEAQSSPGSAGKKWVGKLMDSPEVQEALNNLKTKESNDAVLRIEDTELGNLEVRIQLDGNDLAVQLRAEDTSMRQRMQERFAAVAQALEQEGLVEGEVHVGDFDSTEDNAFSNAEHSGEDNRPSESQPQQRHGFASNPSNQDSTREPARRVLAVA